MPPRVNPLKLNTLQAKTLVLFQELARHPETASRLESGEVFLNSLPKPHGNHFHLGSKVVASSDATGLENAGVWAALERKGLIRGNFPGALALTPLGLEYDTGLSHQILHGSDH
jgi:hypothetical protein